MGLALTLALLVNARAVDDLSALPQQVVLPAFPVALAGGPRDRALCDAVVDVGTDGAVIGVVMDDCAGPMRDAARAALAEWRWLPMPGAARAHVTLGFLDPGPSAPDPGAAPVAMPWNGHPARYRESPAFAQGVPAEWGERKITCAVEVAVSERGVPVAVAASNCLDGFRQQVVEAVLRWRWPRHDHAGTVVRMAERMTFSYWVAK